MSRRLALVTASSLTRPAWISGSSAGATAKSACVSPAASDVPAGGDPAYGTCTAWNGLFAPAGTPPEVVSRINADVNAVLKDPGVLHILAQQGLIPGGGSTAEFKAFIDAESRTWGAIIQKVGITID